MAETKKILIVDDDLYIRDLYEEILKGEGYEVSTAVDGEDGLTKISAGGFDLVLLDVMMPKIDGIGILTKLAEKPPKKKNGPVVILTNLAMDPVIKDALTRGASGVLIKAELTPNQLLGEVKNYLALI